MQTNFPQPKNRFFKAKDFQDNLIVLKFKGWEKEPNQDVEAKGDRGAISWKSRLKYMMRYSYPKVAVDEAGDPIIDADTGEGMINTNWDEKFPQGWTVKYHFEEGILTSGSLPLFNIFGIVQPTPGMKLGIIRTGEGVDTEWKVTKVTTQDFASAEFSGDPEVKEDTDIPF